MSAGEKVDEVATPRFVVFIPLVLAMLSMIGPFSIDTPFPAFPHIRDEFGVTTEQLQLIVTAYLLAFAAMSIFHGPLSDSLGRRPVILGSVAVYAVASAACTFAPTFELLPAGRVLQGLSAGGATIVSRTVIRDLYEGEQAQRLMSRVALIFGPAPAIAPIVGGGLLQIGPWELVFAFRVFLGAVLIVATIIVLPETHPVIARVPLRVGEVVRGLLEVARQPAFHRLAWAGAFGFGAQFLYIGGAAIFVVDLLGLGELDFWVLFVPMIGSMMVGSLVSGRTAGLVTQRKLVSIGYSVTPGRRRDRRRLRGVTAGDGPAVGDHRPEPHRARQRYGLPVDLADDARPGAHPPGCGDVVLDVPGADLQRRGGGRAHAVRRHEHARTGRRRPRDHRARVAVLGPALLSHRADSAQVAGRVGVTCADSAVCLRRLVRREPGSPCSPSGPRRRTCPARAR
ncbi:multidrug effflux MFS transporter [Nocardioides sp. B-3]|uniref:multidrug effflux MFS transporter n=1 Tax=Nocardioides sp. B-3 TaxID=2895565 RepID=UPI00215242E7|nr:multidrug effflux MFS transporter [Nocardioides sp. B-3]UUZ60705.1 multidrug effflux MFS transporter [Nocardioides sp. B-3]